MLVLNELQRVCHENPICRGKPKARAAQISQNLADCDTVILLRNSFQRSLVQINGMNGTPGSQQLRKRRCERSAATTEIAPGLRLRPLNDGSTDEGCCLTDLHL